MGIVLIKNANLKVGELVKRDNVVAALLSTRDSAITRHKYSFSNSIQVLITKVGLIVEEVSLKDKLKSHYCSSCIEFLCKKVVNDKTLYEFFKLLDLNVNGNRYKHSIKESSINIDTTVDCYNMLIDRIINETSLTSLASLRLNIKCKAKDSKTKDVFQEKGSVKYVKVGKNNLTLKVSPTYVVDRFNKSVTNQLTFQWENESPDIIEYKITSNNEKKRTLASSKLKLSNKHQKSLDLSYGKGEIINNAVSMDVVLTSYKIVNVTKTRLVKVTKERIVGHIIKKRVPYTEYVNEKYIVQEKRETGRAFVTLVQGLKREVSRL